MASKVINIIQGQDANINLFLVYKETKRPYSLVGATEIEVRFPGTAILTKKLSLVGLSVVGVGELGHILIPLTEIETAAFKVADGQAIFVQVDKGTDRKKFNKAGILNVAKDAVASA